MMALQEDEIDYFTKEHNILCQNILDNISWKKKYENICNIKLYMQNIDYKEEFHKNAKITFEKIILSYTHDMNKISPTKTRENILIQLLEYIHKNIDMFNLYKKTDICTIIRFRIYEIKFHMTYEDHDNLSKIDKLYRNIFGTTEQFDFKLCELIIKHKLYIDKMRTNNIVTKNIDVCEGHHDYEKNVEYFSYEDIFG